MLAGNARRASSLALHGYLWHNRDMSRRVKFLLALLVGVIIGLVYGWVISPVHYVDSSPDALSPDFKADYALMTAEAFQREANLETAVRRLAALGGDPLGVTQQAILTGRQLNYSPHDLEMMASLAQRLQTYTPQPGGNTP